MEHTNPAFNYVPFVDPNKLVVKRKGKVIKGETEEAIAAARKERQAAKNAMKRARQSRRSK